MHEQEKNLVKKLINGDEQAFNELYHRYVERLGKFVVSIIKIETDAEDIVQQVFTNVWLKRESINAELNFSTYLYTVAKNTTLNAIRSANVQRDYLRDQMWKSIELNRCFTDETIEYDELLKQIQEALNKLSPHKKQIFELSRKDGLTHEEIATKLKISKNTVKNHMTESIKLIKKEIETNSNPNSALAILLLWLFS
jgi:RNA polymerase sigma-70 factor (ECF subfamily)